MDIIGEEIAYYKANRKEFIRLYAGKHLVIKGMEIVGIYNSRTEATDTAAMQYDPGTYIIERPLDVMK